MVEAPQGMTGSQNPGEPAFAPQPPGQFCIPLHCPFKRSASSLTEEVPGTQPKLAKVADYKSTLALPWQWALL